MKHCLCLLLVAAICLPCSADNIKDILRETQAKLEVIHSATYECVFRDWEPYGKEEERPLRTAKFMEVDNPADSYAGCSYVEWQDGKMTMCYDGSRKMVLDQRQSGTFEIDSVFRGIREYRILGIPFYHTCRRLIDYALQPTDSISLSLSETDALYTIDLVIYGEVKVEFSMARLDPHLTDTYGVLLDDPTSHYILKISRKTMLPVEYCRLMSHQNSRIAVVGNPLIRKDQVPPLNCYALIPEGYTEYNAQKTEAKPTPDLLIGKPAPIFQLCDEDGKKVTLDTGNGKTKLLMFTGVGCGWCKKALPFVNGLMAKADERQMEIIGLECWGRSASDVRDYRHHQKILFPVLVGAKSILPQYHLDGSAPHFFIIGKEGTVEAHFSGWSKSVEDGILSQISGK